MPEVRVQTAVAGAALALIVGLGASGCSKPAASPTAPSASPAAQSAPLVVRFSQITGRLPAAGRTRLRTEVGAVLDRWWQSGYLGTASGDPFAGSFTPGAAKLARRDADQLSNAGMAGITNVVAKRREADLDVLAVQGAAKGVTAVVHLRYAASGQHLQVCVVGGTVSLTPSPSGWRIFGYDVAHTCQPRKAGS